MRIFPVMCASALHNIGAGPDPGFHRGIPARADRARGGHGQRQRRGSQPAKSPMATHARLCVFKTTADPFAGRITYFKVITGVVKNDANLLQCRRAARPSAWRTWACPQGKTLQPVTEIARRRHRRGRQAEGHADGRHPGGQGRQRRLSAGETAGAVHRVRHRGQVAQRRGPHGQRGPPDPGRGPVAALLPRSADARISAGRHAASSTWKSWSAG